MAPKYESTLPMDEEEQFLPEATPSTERTTNRKRRWLTRTTWTPPLSTCKDVVLMALAALGLVSLMYSQAVCHGRPGDAAAATAAAARTTSCSCGNSTAQARALGCKYDSLAAAWLPPHCRDDELTAEFDRSGPGKDGAWTYWRDRERTREISLAELAEMGDDRSFRFYMTGRWHVVHCIFYWRKEHRARLTGRVVEPRSDGEGHIKHCGRVILGPDRDTVAGVELNADE
ncbi:hypothetical protein E4U41_002849 [Claviceps citrina]|nr:hypothetical protein E4U41_002849 [Claviceps citrina]